MVENEVRRSAAADSSVIEISRLQRISSVTGSKSCFALIIHALQSAYSTAGRIDDATTPLLRSQESGTRHRRSRVLPAARRDGSSHARAQDRRPHPNGPGLDRAQGTAEPRRRARRTASVRLQRLEPAQPARALLGGTLAPVRGRARDGRQTPLVVPAVPEADP